MALVCSHWFCDRQRKRASIRQPKDLESDEGPRIIPFWRTTPNTACFGVNFCSSQKESGIPLWGILLRRPQLKPCFCGSGDVRISHVFGVNPCNMNPWHAWGRVFTCSWTAVPGLRGQHQSATFRGSSDSFYTILPRLYFYRKS